MAGPISLGEGGDGGEIELRIFRGGDGTIEITRSGSAAADFVPSSWPVPEPGGPYSDVHSAVQVELATGVEPPANTLYAMSGDTTLYSSDGDGDVATGTVMVGLMIADGGSLELPINFPAQGLARFEFTHQVQNLGLITVADVDAGQRGGLEINAASYAGDGSIDTSGVLPGQDGGKIQVNLESGSGSNSGRWTAAGADDPIGDGGDAGSIEFRQSAGDKAGFVENTGEMVARGGDATGLDGVGGSGGFIWLGANGHVWNDGHLDSSGGDGVDLAGDAGSLTLSTFYVGEIRNTGGLDAMGGQAANAGGGRGGEIYLQPAGGDLLSSGPLTTRGGDATQDASRGGEGGTVYLTSTPGNDLSPIPEDPRTPAGDVWLSSEIDTRGGDGLGLGGSGGDGGAIDVTIDNSVSLGDQSIHLVGYAAISGPGGDGWEGGDGADMEIDVSDAGIEPRTGAFLSEVPIDVSGGDADPAVAGSEGGEGGWIEIVAGSIDYDEVDVSGGTGEQPGLWGFVPPET